MCPPGKRKTHGLTIKIESPTTEEGSSAGIVEEEAGLNRSPNMYLSGVSISRSPSEAGTGRWGREALWANLIDYPQI